MFIDLDLYTVIIMLIGISLGGFLKGVISFGFPLVALPILSLALPPKPAIFLLFFFSNICKYKRIKSW